MLTIKGSGMPKKIAQKALNLEAGTAFRVDNGLRVTTYVVTDDNQPAYQGSYRYRRHLRERPIETRSRALADKASMYEAQSTACAIAEPTTSYQSPPPPTIMELSQAATHFWPGSYYNYVKVNNHQTVVASLQNHGHYMDCPDDLYIMAISEKLYIANKHSGGRYKPDYAFTNILTDIVYEQRLKECVQCNGKQCYGPIVCKSKNTIVLQFNIEVLAAKIADKSRYAMQEISINEARYALNKWLPKRLQRVLDGITNEIFCPRNGFVARGFWDAITEHEEGEDDF